MLANIAYTGASGTHFWCRQSISVSCFHIFFGLVITEGQKDFAVNETTPQDLNLKAVPIGVFPGKSDAPAIISSQNHSHGFQQMSKQLLIVTNSLLYNATVMSYCNLVSKCRTTPFKVFRP